MIIAKTFSFDINQWSCHFQQRPLPLNRHLFPLPKALKLISQYHAANHRQNSSQCHRFALLLFCASSFASKALAIEFTHKPRAQNRTTGNRHSKHRQLKLLTPMISVNRNHNRHRLTKIYDLIWQSIKRRVHHFSSRVAIAISCDTKLLKIVRICLRIQANTT